ncbi:hypothetical protein [Microcella humidisoli]|uniref:Bacterial Ig-like domain-containing protein n=1 Tax=Microcella humidisoli TaxID=2963406 RepID=A0ABY5FU23_9MICO|nr:hypothetical protein [Microcella humidisoli]UTT61801.1 hypothetical protein NNL39_08930 [Microcella humidisoli]
MLRSRSFVRRLATATAVSLLAGASVIAGVTVANAAPGAPSITAPTDGFETVATTFTVSGDLAESIEQVVTVEARINGAYSAGCSVLVAYFDTTYSCDITVAGPGRYELTATSYDAADVDQIPSPVSNAVTVTVGGTAPALLGYSESGTEWSTVSPGLSGTGPAFGTVEVEILAGEGSATYCVAEVSASGDWSCSSTVNPFWTWGDVEFRAYGYDVTGGSTADDQIVGELVPPPPTSGITLGPARVTLTAQGAADTFFQTRVYRAVLNGEGSSFTLREECMADGDPPVVDCAVSALPAGIWNFYTVQDFEERYFSTLDEYVRIPATPTSFAATVLADQQVRFSGQGQPGFRAIVRDADGDGVCSATVSPSGAWQCVVPRPIGTESYRALQQSVGFDTADFFVSSDRSLDGFSAYTAARTVTVTAPAPPVAPAVEPTPLPWVLEGYDGGPLTPGQQLTLTASGLPAGTEVVVEIRSTPQVLGSTLVGDTGSFALDVVVPTDLEPGEHTLVAIATPPDGVASPVAIPVSVVAAPAIDPAKETAPSSAPEKTEAAAAAGESGSSDGVDRSDPAAPSAISDSIPTIDRIVRTPLFAITAGGLALAILLLVAFPAELLNSTLASNTRRLGRWYAAIEDRVERATEWFAAVTRTRALAAAVLVVLTALIFGFVDPDYGFDPVSLRMTVSLAIGLFIITYVSAWISGAIIRRVWSIPTRVSLQPAALLFAVIGVVVARLLEFSPGFLIGLVIGLDLLTRVGAQYRVRATLTSVGVTVGLALLGWVGYSILAAVASGEPTVLDLLVSDALVATAAEGLTASLASLLPLGFLQGHEIFRRSKGLWAATFVVVATLFALVVLPTASSTEGEVADVGFWMLVMVIFAVATLTLWAVLQFTGRGDDEHDALVDEPVAAGR